jgi:hypothetical protein
MFDCQSTIRAHEACDLNEASQLHYIKCKDVVQCMQLHKSGDRSKIGELCCLPFAVLILAMVSTPTIKSCC